MLFSTKPFRRQPERFIMSHEATNWAFEIKLPPAQKMVLLALANCHNPNHGCFPSQEYICEITCMSDKTVRRHLNVLEGMGLISRERVRDDKKKWAHTEYELHIKSYRPNVPVEKLPVKTGQATGQNGAKLPVKQGQSYRSKLPTNTVKEPVKEIGKRTVSGFDEFWEVYPKKVGKQAALKNWKKLKCDDNADHIISKAKEFAESVKGQDRQYIKHPQGWLTDGRWDDELEPCSQQFGSNGTRLMHEKYREMAERTRQDDRILKLVN